MVTVQPPVRYEHCRCTPATFPCPTCGVPGRRKGRRTFTRTVRCLAYREIRLIQLTTAEYRAHCDCCTTFRSQVEGILPRADYTNRVREAVLDRLLDDKLTVEQLRRALARDFYLELSEGFVYDCLDWKVQQTDGVAYRQWTLEQFSGTLCIDEIHLGQKTTLLAERDSVKQQARLSGAVCHAPWWAGPPLCRLRAVCGPTVVVGATARTSTR
jgi:hypothetical protein